MIVIAADRLGEVHAQLTEQGYAVASARTPVEAGLRPAQKALAEALRLPGSAGANLDALADALRDVTDVWETEHVALVWEDAERLAAADGRAWWLLAEILDEAEDLLVVVVGEPRVGRAPADET